MEKVEKKSETMEENSKQVKPLVSCRVLFISVLDKIYIIVLLLMLIGLTINNFSGDMSSLDYHFWSKVGSEIVILIGLFITYLIFNWFYKCAAKTMLCVTKTEVYREKYIPLYRWETTIPLNKITGVTTFKFFWIFRAVVVHQYSKLPMIFWTWNNQEFKDKVDELIIARKEKVENEYENRNIVTSDKYKYVAYVGIILAFIIVLLGIVRFFSYITSDERKVAGTYTHSKESIVLEKDGTCDIDDIRDNVTECTWSYDSEEKVVNVTYEYKSSYFYGTYTGYLEFDFDSKNETLTYDAEVYKK